MKLRYTLPALADLSSVLDYIAAHSPQGARRVQTRIQAIIDLLLLHPGIGTRTDDPTIRRMAALPYPYLIFYEGDGKRDHHSCGAPHGARSVRHAGRFLIRQRKSPC